MGCGLLASTLDAESRDSHRIFTREYEHDGLRGCFGMGIEAEIEGFDIDTDIFHRKKMLEAKP